MGIACFRIFQDDLICVSFQGKAELLGRTFAVPVIHLDPSKAVSPVLRWYDVKKGDTPGGELLAAFEAYLVCLAFKSALRSNPAICNDTRAMVAYNSEYSFEKLKLRVELNRGFRFCFNVRLGFMHLDALFAEEM